MSAGRHHHHDNPEPAVAGSSAEKKPGLAYWADRVLEECDKASHDFAADPVHDLRVAIRRCRSMADGFLSVDPDPAWRQMKKLGKGLFASLGELRDTQVMMEWVAKLSAEDDPLRLILIEFAAAERRSPEAGREDGSQQLRPQALDSAKHQTGRTRHTRSAGGAVFQYLALERWHDAYELHRTALRNRSAVAYHQLRIGIKRFRYTVENFLPERHQVGRATCANCRMPLERYTTSTCCGRWSNPILKSAWKNASCGSRPSQTSG